MKRKALIFVLAMVILVSMFPVTAHAANEMQPSNSCIDLIKKFEGYREFPYWDYKQWSMGYGSKCPDDQLAYYKEHGISEEEAEELLLEQMQTYVDSVNRFADRYNLNFTQSQFDALVSFTYNVGGNWTNGANTMLFTKAVLQGKTGNDFLSIMCIWSNAGNALSLPLVERRMIEANLYLNGVCSYDVPSNYKYVLFNHTDSLFYGTSQTVRVLGFDSTKPVNEMPKGVKSGYRFLGWYTKSTGGEWVETPTAALHGKTLYAHWQKNEGNVDSSGNIQGTAASYSRTASGAVKIYAQPSKSSGITGTIKRGATMNIVADYITADDVKWGLLQQGGWVCLSSGGSEDTTPPTTEPETQPEATKPAEKVVARGMVSLSSGTLNIRAGAGDTYNKVGSLNNGEFVDLYELKTVGSHQWGRMSRGWIRMDYVKVAETKTMPVDSVNIRSAAGTSNKLLGTYVKGDTIYIYETTKVGNVVWGHTDRGWINLSYCNLAGDQEETVVATGKVTKDELNIRKGAGSSYAVIGTYKKGTSLKFYEIKKVGNISWARTNKGWVGLAGVKLDETVIATGKVTKDNLNIRKGPGTTYAVIDNYKKGTSVKFYETKKVGTTTWGRTDKGWVGMSGVQLDGEKTETVIATGKVTKDSLNIRKGAGSSYAVIGTYKKGTSLKFYEIKKVGNISWARTNKGWVGLAGVKLDETVIATGKVTKDNLNIRKGPGTTYAVIATYKKGTSVKFYETKKVGTTTWGRTNKGWVGMSGVQLDGEKTETVIATGKVTKDSLNIRKGPGTTYAVIATYKKGTSVKFYETKKVGTTTWGRTNKGWVGMSGVQLDGEKTETVIATGKVTKDSLNIRKGAGSSYAVTGTYKKNTTLKFYEIKKVGSTTWARTNKGWVGLAGVKLESANVFASRTGTVNVTGTLNVRKGAGTSYAKVGTVKDGDKLTITTLKMVDGVAWGKISSGWVSLDHVIMSKPAAGAPALTMGTDLNIRKGAGTNYAVAGKYDKGVVITVLETKVVSGVRWARTNKGWVSMDYVL